MVTKGIHHGMGMAEYHSWKLDKSNLIEGPISCSMLKDFDANPYAWLKSGDRKTTDALRTGQLFDAAVTDPGELDSILVPPADLEPCEILPFDSLRTKEAKEWKKERESNGVRVLKQSEYEDELESHKAAIEDYNSMCIHLDKARDAVYNHPIAGKIMEGATFQTAAVGEVGGIPAKCLIDILPSETGDYSETLVDYKTTSLGLDDESIRRSIGKWKYHWQAAFYRTLFNKASEDRVCEDFAFIFQDTKTLEVRVITLGDDSLILGTRAVGEAIKNFVTCAHKGIKSRYLKRASTLELMPYHAMNEEDELNNKPNNDNE